jgi:hypothetical protein
MNKMKQIAAFILIFFGWMFIVSAVGWIMMKGWIFCSYLRANWCGIAILRQKAKRAFCVG